MNIELLFILHLLKETSPALPLLIQCGYNACIPSLHLHRSMDNVTLNEEDAEYSDNRGECVIEELDEVL